VEYCNCVKEVKGDQIREFFEFFLKTVMVGAVMVGYGSRSHRLKDRKLSHLEEAWQRLAVVDRCLGKER
jgi:hypothetical protein